MPSTRSCARSAGCFTSRSGSSPEATCRSGPCATSKASASSWARGIAARAALPAAVECQWRRRQRRHLHRRRAPGRRRSPAFGHCRRRDHRPCRRHGQDPAAPARAQHPPDGFHPGGGSVHQPLPGADQGRLAPRSGRVRSAAAHRRHHAAVDHVALVVRPDMQPALVSLLTHAVVHNPKSGFDKHGDPVLFYRAGEFPSGTTRNSRSQTRPGSSTVPASFRSF